MKNLIRWFTLITLLLGLLAPLVSAKAGSASFGDYQIFYAARPTANLSPEVAQQYGIVRSRTQAMVIISVREDDSPIRARVGGSAYTDSGQPRDIRFRRVEAGDAVNYVGTFRADHLETLRFQLDVMPETGQQSYPVRFRETFHME